MLVKKSEVKNFAKSENGEVRVSVDFIERLDKEVQYLIQCAIIRVAGNSRKTLKEYDV